MRVLTWTMWCLSRHPAETENHYITILRVLNKPVTNIQDRLNAIGLWRLSDTLPIQNLLADLLGCSRDEYRHMMVEWLLFASSHVHMIEKWLAVRDLTLSEYLDHLHQGGTSDGYEVWCFSLAMDRPINVVQESEVWSTATEGIDFQYAVILMTTYMEGFLCVLEEVENIQLMAQPLQPLSRGVGVLPVSKPG